MHDMQLIEKPTWDVTHVPQEAFILMIWWWNVI